MKVQKVLLKKSVAMASMAFLLGGGLSIAAPAQKAPKEAKDSPSGFFLGAELGYSAIFGIVDEKDSTTNAITTTTRTDNFALGNIGAKLGYTHFFNKWVGLRGYASYTYAYDYTNTIKKTPASGTTAATTTTSPTLDSHHQVAANVDVAFKFFDVSGVGLGAFVGIGAGYATTNNTATNLDENTNTTTTTTQNYANGFVLPVNAGLEVYMGKHHNASLNFRIPTLAYKGSTTDANQEANQTTTSTIREFRNLIITVGYSYTF